MAIGEALRIRLPFPHPGQQVILGSRKRFKWLAAGRRWRKTTLALNPVVESCLAGNEIIWGAPTYDQCRTGWEELQHAGRGVIDFKEQRMEAVFPGGGRTLFRSLDDPNNARSKTAMGFVMDEAAYCHPAAWPEVIRPILSDTGGWALLLTTPKGRNWFWQSWTAAKDQDDADSWTVPTLGVVIQDGMLVRKPHLLENPFFPFAEAEKLYRTLPERVFRQEFLGEFTENGGGVFRRVQESATATRQERGFEFPHRYIIGVDWGKYEDFTAICVVDLFTRECVAVDRFRQIDFAVQYDRLRVWWERFNKCGIIAERNAMGDPAVEQVQRMGLPVQPFITTNETKREAIETLALAFEQGTIRIIPDENLLGELVAYQTERLPSGLLRYSAPHGMHDDMVMALAMAWQGVGPVLQQKMEPIWGEKRISVEVPW